MELSHLELLFISFLVQILCSTQHHGSLRALGCRAHTKRPEQKNGRLLQPWVRPKSFTASHQCSYFSKRDNKVHNPKFSEDFLKEDLRLKEIMDKSLKEGGNEAERREKRRTFKRTSWL